MIKLLFLLILLLVGLVGGPYLAGKQGYVLISLASYDIEMSVTGLIICMIAMLAFFYVVEWIISSFFNLSQNAYHFFAVRRHKKAHQQTLEGIKKGMEGNYKKAEKLISKNAKYLSDPVTSYVKAAELAQQQGDSVSANRYLQDAMKQAKECDKLMLNIARIRILLQQQNIILANQILKETLKQYPNNPELLKIAYDVYVESEQYDELDSLLPALERYHILDRASLEKRQEEILEKELLQKATQESTADFIHWWQAQPRRRQQHPHQQRLFIQCLLDNKADEEAYPYLLKAIKTLKNDDLHLLLAMIQSLLVKNNKKLMTLVQKQAQFAKPEDVFYFDRSLGYLAANANQFEEAKTYFRSVLRQPERLEVADFAMIAYVLEKNGDLSQAEKIRQEAQTRLITIKKET